MLAEGNTGVTEEDRVTPLLTEATKAHRGGMIGDFEVAEHEGIQQLRAADMVLLGMAAVFAIAVGR
ncbi:hypothetical protein D3C84_1270170 [compost metagenome]